MKNNKIKGVGSYRIQYVSARCTECGVNTEESYTFKGRCADCRANEYGVMPHQAMEYEFKNGMREEAEVEVEASTSTIETAETPNAKGETAMKRSTHANNVTVLISAEVMSRMLIEQSTLLTDHLMKRYSVDCTVTAKKLVTRTSSSNPTVYGDFTVKVRNGRTYIPFSLTARYNEDAKQWELI